MDIWKRHRLRRGLISVSNVATVVIVWIIAAGCAVGQSPTVVISESKNSGRVTLFATLHGSCDQATVTISLTLDNGAASPASPVTVVVLGTEKRPVTTLSRSNPSLPWSYHYDAHWQLGPHKTDTPTDYVYALPFAARHHFRVTQGFFGNFSHQKGTVDEYGIDFGMPVGTPVLAARAGRVVAVKEDSNIGGGDKRYKDYGNFVYIAHNDNSFAIYQHLMLNGATVQLGDMIKPGQLIGFSGNTGFSSQPHLHFGVYQNLDGYQRKSTPIRFRTSSGAIAVPRQGQTY